MLDSILDEDDDVFEEGTETVESHGVTNASNVHKEVVLDTLNPEEASDQVEVQSNNELTGEPVAAAAYLLHPETGAPLNLHLVGDKVQPGRVYRLESRLPIPLDLHMRGKDVIPGKVYKLKRLSSNVKQPTKDKKKHKIKKKKLPVKDWFIKKITFSRKPPDDPDDFQPPELAT